MNIFPGAVDNSQEQLANSQERLVMTLTIQSSALGLNFMCSGVVWDFDASGSPVSSKRKKSYEENGYGVTSNSSKNEEVGENE